MNSRESERYAIITDKVWDGVSDKSVNGVAVVISGGMIERICAVDNLPAGIDRITFDKNSILLPGLIDAHIHYSPWMGPAFLAAGVTTVRDTGCDVDWILHQCAVNESDVAAGPEIIPCGQLLDGPKPYWHYIGRGHNHPDELCESIRRQAERGIRFVKFYDGLDQEFIRRGAEEARRLGLWILSDFGTDDPKAEQAVRAGVNDIQHLTGCPPAWHRSSVQEQDQLIDLLLEHNVVNTATLITFDHLGRAMELQYQFDSRNKWVHPFYLDLWRTLPVCQHEQRQAQREQFQFASLNQKRFVRRLYERNARLAIGTDTPFQFIIPGFSVHDELAMWVDAGLPAVAALRAATSQNAALLGEGDRLGQIKPGYQADFIVCTADPLDNIHNIAQIGCVVRRGVRLLNDELTQRSSAACAQTLHDPITRDLARYLAKITKAPS